MEAAAEAEVVMGANRRPGNVNVAVFPLPLPFLLSLVSVILSAVFPSIHNGTAILSLSSEAKGEHMVISEIRQH